jgi:hypothetical protein
MAISLVVTWLLSKKGYEKWGWIVGFFGLFGWVAEEWWFRQYFYLALNPIYFYLYLKGWKKCQRK